jgi:multidrug resistance efflux pump
VAACALILSACTETSAPPVETPARVASMVASPVAADQGSRQTTPVRRGTIIETLSLSGRVSGQDEVGVGLTVLTRVDSVAVKPGQNVDEGQELLQGDSKQLQKDLAAARAQLAASRSRLEQAYAQDEKSQRETARRGAADRGRRATAVAEAESALRRARADYEHVQAGASPSERRSAEAAVASANAGVDRASADLARAQAGPNPADVRLAEQQVTSARLAVQRAEADFAKLTSGPDPVELRGAERELALAQNGVDKAQAELDRLQRGPDPDVLAAAQRDVQRAESGLRTAEATKASDKASRAARDAAVTNARLTLEDARNRLARARQGPDPVDVEAARRNLQAARLTLASARDRVDSVRKGPDQVSVDTAKAAVESAKLALDNAESKLESINSGPSDEDLAGLQQAIGGAQVNAAVAQARLAEVNSRPTRQEVRDAADRIAAAQAALARAQADVEGDGEPAAATDFPPLENAIEQDQSRVAELEHELEALRLVSPFAGVVTAVHVKAGDPVEPGRPLIVMAKPFDPIVTADMNDRDAARLAAGQTASMLLEGSELPVQGVVIGLSEAKPTAGRSAQIRAHWPEVRPAFGTVAELAVAVQQKDNVLIVPQRAVRSVGPRRYVEVLENGIRRAVDIEVGIVADGDAEVVRGLNEGQPVVVAS